MTSTEFQPRSALSGIPVLGVGLGFRPPFYRNLLRNEDAVDFLEITADHYFDAPLEKERELDRLQERFTLIPHGLSLSLGSAEGIDHEYVDKLAAQVERVDPPYWSEHIAFTGAGGVDIGHLAPLPFSRESIDVVCRNIREVRRSIDRPLILENISYVVNLPGAEMKEGEFIREILESTDCGLLLDVTNLYINSLNLGYDAIAVLDELPMERVVQLHFVGGHWHDGVLIDSHSRATPQEIFDLMDAVVERSPLKGIILERDDNIPPFAELARELETARDIGRKHSRWD